MLCPTGMGRLYRMKLTCSSTVKKTRRLAIGNFPILVGARMNPKVVAFPSTIRGPRKLRLRAQVRELRRALTLALMLLPEADYASLRLSLLAPLDRRRPVSEKISRMGSAVA